MYIYLIKPIKIIQTSPPHTGSTLLLNLIHGYLLPECKIVWGEDNNELEKVYIKETDLIVKTHINNIDKIIDDYKEYDLYFIVSIRHDEKIQRNIKKNIIVIKMY